MYLHLVDTLKQAFGEQHLRNVHPRFENYEGTRILAIECWRSDEPVFYTHDGSEHFYIRAGVTTKELTVVQVEKFIKQRFGK